MEKYRGKAYQMITQRGYEVKMDRAENKIEFNEIGIITKEKRELITNEVYEALRDASSTETARAI